MTSEYVEMSDELSAALRDADKAVREAVDRLNAAEAAQQRLLDDAIAPLAKFAVGQDVTCYGQRHRVTKIRGESFGLSGERSKVWLYYYGQRIKLNGEPMGRIKKLYDAQPVTD